MISSKLRKNEFLEGGCSANVPTAVNLLLTWIIMIVVMISAAMWQKDAAPWKMMVLANSIFRAKHSASMP